MAEINGDKTAPVTDKQKETAGQRLLEDAWEGAGKPAAQGLWWAVQPGVSAVATRATILGVSGRLHYTLNDVARTLQNLDSPTGQQLATRMQQMHTDGWRFDALSEFRNTFRRGPQAMEGMETAGSLSTEVRILEYEKPSMWRHVLGLADHPLKQTTSLVAHELAHKDGILHYPSDRLYGNAAEMKTMAFRTLASETNASLCEIHVAGTLGDTAMAKPLIDAVKQRNLGGYIWDNYQSKSMGLITRTEAQEFVNGWIDKQYGSTVDVRTGRVGPIDILKDRSYLGEALSYDRECASRAATLDSALFYRTARNLEYRPLSLASLSETTAGSALMHGAKILGAVGLLATTADIVGHFQQSLGSGVGRTAYVAAGFAGFELGAGMARMALGPAPEPLKVLAAGFIGALIAERTIGMKLETTLQTCIDGKPH